MRKIITLLFFVLLFASCKVNREFNVEYKLTYKVYYPSETVTKSFSFKGVEGEAAVEVSSFRGTNSLYVKSHKSRPFEAGSLSNVRTIESTTAPIQLISVEKIK